jgi:hypothetical protein
MLFTPHPPFLAPNPSRLTTRHASPPVTPRPSLLTTTPIPSPRTIHSLLLWSFIGVSIASDIFMVSTQYKAQRTKFNSFSNWWSSKYLKYNVHKVGGGGGRLETLSNVAGGDRDDHFKGNAEDDND